MRLNIDKRWKKSGRIAAVCMILAAIGISEISAPVAVYGTQEQTEGESISQDGTETTEAGEEGADSGSSGDEGLGDTVEDAVYATGKTALTGTVTANNVNVRSGAGTSYATIGVKVNEGQSVTIKGEQTTNGTVWYEVEFTKDGKDYAGWIISTYISIAEDSSSEEVDEEYVQSLKDLGFPDSYCTSLAVLHEKYPSWQFIPVLTGLDWKTAVEQESRAGVNLVQSIVNDSRKSTEDFAYDWKTNKWYGFDGADWVCASADFIAYCMDPRNFLNETYIFQFETLEYASYQTADGVSSILANTFMSGKYKDTDKKKKSYADTFVEVGSALAVSPYHLAARCKQEQGVNGTSDLISGTYSGYEGYYNYFNVGAYTTTSADKVVNGLAYAKKMGWDSIYGSIAGGSEVVANNYIKKGQNTIYFEKFNVINPANLYAHQYMTNVMAAISEGSSSGKAYSDKDQAFVFRIPVYENMPDSAVTFTDTGNPNNWLSSLKIAGQSLTPSFSGSKTEYALVVGADIGTIELSAKAVASTSKVSGAGTYSLEYGDNVITVTCVSQSGSTRNYNIRVVRQMPCDGSEIAVAENASFTPAFSVGTYATGIEPGTSVSDVKAQITTNNCTVKMLTAEGQENTDTVATGNKLAVYDTEGNLLKQYDVVVYGDINGDGKVSNVDLVLMQKQILGISTLEGSSLEAADTSKGGGVSNKDMVILQKHILGIETISQ
ncbi:MAG: dockerin type I domain-containing protein [Roseburia sp.]